MQRNSQDIQKFIDSVQPNIQPDDITPNYTSAHSHNGVDTPRLRITDIQGIGNLIQIIKVSDATVAPTYVPQFIPLVFQYDVVAGGHYVGWLRVNNLWKKFTLS